MKKLCFALVGALLIGATPMSRIVTPAKAEQQVEYLSNSGSETIVHWANDNLIWAKNDGILSKIGAENRDPEAAVTRAEFVKMTIAAMKLTTDSSIVKRTASSRSHLIEEASEDLKSHSIANDEMLTIAMNSELISSDDYIDGRYRPDDNITRYDAIVITSRMAGLMYPASQNDGSSFKYKDTVADGQKGTVAELTNRAMLFGYDDGYVRTDKYLTLAEACTLLKRAVDFTEQGIDTSITVTLYLKYGYDLNQPTEEMYYIDKNSETMPIETDVPLQVIDDVIYIPALAYHYERWWPEANKYYTHDWWCGEWRYLKGQRLKIEVAATGKTFQIGSSNYIDENISHYYDTASNETIFKECRMMRGEIMMPVYDLKNDSGKHAVYNAARKCHDTLIIAEYDAETKHLYLAPGPANENYGS